jgi:hypothetical protein
VRAVLVALLTLAIAAPAEAAWSDPQLGPVTGTPHASGGVTADGTPVVAWENGRTASVRIGTGAPKAFPAHSFIANLDVPVGGDQIAAFWVDGPTTWIAAGSVGAGLGEPVALPGALVASAANRAGEMVLLLLEPGGAALSWRPPDGTFGPGVTTPEHDSTAVESLALGPTGEALVGWVSSREVQVASSSRGGAFSSPVSLPGDAAYESPALALDAHGRAVAAWHSALFGSSGALTDAGSIAVRRQGTWQSASGVPGDFGYKPEIGTGDDGQAVIVWHDAPTTSVAPISLADAAVGPATEFPVPIEAAVPYPPENVGTFRPASMLRVGKDGSASLTWGDKRRVLVVQREGTGAFGSPEVAACQVLFTSVPKPLGFDDGGRAGVLFNAYPGGELATARDLGPGGAVTTCPDAEPRRPSPTITHRPRRVYVGELVRLTVTGARQANALEVLRNEWSTGGFGPPLIGDRPMFEFDEAGPQEIFLLSRQRYEGPVPDAATGATHVVRVFARATLTAAPRQHRRLQVRASALSYGPRARVTLLAKRRGIVRAKVTRLLGPFAELVELSVRKPGPYVVELRQGGKIRAKAGVRVV